MARGFHDLGETADALIAGDLLLFPTDTLPGFHCRADRPDVVRRLIALKGRPDGKPLLLLAGSLAQVLALTPGIAPRQRAVCRRCWPGPFSLILPARDDLLTEVTGGTGTFAARIPGLKVLRDLVRAVGVPLVTTSANAAGGTPCPDLPSAAGLFADQVDGFWDHGVPLHTAGPSALVDLTIWPPRLLRSGPRALPDIPEGGLS